MSGNDSMRFRPSALFPFVCSAVAFALILMLVLSGNQPDSIPDGYLLTFNTTSVGQRLIEFSSANAVTPTANVSARSIIADPVASSSTSPNTTTASAASLSVTSNSSSTAIVAPTLVVPPAAGPTNPAAIPITLVGTVFQLMLNTFASGMGQTLQNIMSVVITTQKQSLGVDQYYTMHLTGICKGSLFSTNTTSPASAFNVTRCLTYGDIGNYIANSTANVSDSTLIAALNITAPAISKLPEFGKSAESLINKIAIIVLAVFIIGLIGNGASIILSVAAFLLPSNGKVHAWAAGITTLSTQLLQVAAFTSTTIAVSMSSSINSNSDVFGLSAIVGGKYLALIWIGYIAAQAANSYWMTTWFVKFRTTSFKKRQRTPQQMNAGYRAIGKEVMSDFKLQKVDYDDTERLTQDPVEVRHWNDSYKQM